MDPDEQQQKPAAVQHIHVRQAAQTVDERTASIPDALDDEDEASEAAAQPMDAMPQAAAPQEKTAEAAGTADATSSGTQLPDIAASGAAEAPAASEPFDFSGATAVATVGGPRPALEDVGAAPLFEKVVSICDAASKGRILVLPKRAAVDHFNCSNGKVGVTVECLDTFGNRHQLLHRFWTNVKSRMYLLDGLESVFWAYRIQAGDVLCFGRQQDGKLVVSARKPAADEQQRTRPAGSEPPAKAQRTETRSSLRRQGKRPKAPPIQRADSVEREISDEEDAMYFVPPRDGVFRAMLPAAAPGPHAAQILDHGDCFSATVAVEQELYQAFFESLEAAQEAFGVWGEQAPMCAASAPAEQALAAQQPISMA